MFLNANVLQTKGLLWTGACETGLRRKEAFSPLPPTRMRLPQEARENQHFRVGPWGEWEVNGWFGEGEAIEVIVSNPNENS